MNRMRFWTSPAVVTRISNPLFGEADELDLTDLGHVLPGRHDHAGKMVNPTAVGGRIGDALGFARLDVALDLLHCPAPRGCTVSRLCLRRNGSPGGRDTARSRGVVRGRLVM